MAALLKEERAVNRSQKNNTIRKHLHIVLCVTRFLWDCIDSLSCRRARFKRSNSVTASVQADLDPEGFPGLSIAVPMQDKSLQFGCSFQRHSSEPESASQYTECHRTVHTQGQWAYKEVAVSNCSCRITGSCWSFTETIKYVTFWLHWSLKENFCHFHFNAPLGFI